MYLLHVRCVLLIIFMLIPDQQECCRFSKAVQVAHQHDLLHRGDCSPAVTAPLDSNVKLSQDVVCEQDFLKVNMHCVFSICGFEWRLLELYEECENRWLMCLPAMLEQ